LTEKSIDEIVSLIQTDGQAKSLFERLKGAGIHIPGFGHGGSPLIEGFHETVLWETRFVRCAPEKGGSPVSFIWKNREFRVVEVLKQWQDLTTVLLRPGKDWRSRRHRNGFQIRTENR